MGFGKVCEGYKEVRHIEMEPDLERDKEAETGAGRDGETK
jgi:hypothetical protein